MRSFNALIISLLSWGSFVAASPLRKRSSHPYRKSTPLVDRYLLTVPNCSVGHYHPSANPPSYPPAYPPSYPPAGSPSVTDCSECPPASSSKAGANQCMDCELDSWAFGGSSCTPVAIPVHDPSTQRDVQFDFKGSNFADFILKGAVSTQKFNATITFALAKFSIAESVWITKWWSVLSSGSIYTGARMTYPRETKMDDMDSDVRSITANAATLFGDLSDWAVTSVAFVANTCKLPYGYTLASGGGSATTNAAGTVTANPTCSAGYSSTSTPSVRVCNTQDGAWSFTPPCVAACTVPTGYTCAGGATSSASGACSSAKCATGYTGTPTAPTCTIAGNPWTFTGSCAAACTVPTGYTCAGGAISLVSGACSSAMCAAGYTGTPTAPTCTIAGNPWTFTGSCAANTCKLPAGYTLASGGGTATAITSGNVTANPTCSTGYSSTITPTVPVCNTQDGAWSFNAPCVANTCKLLTGFAIIGTATSSTSGTVTSVSCASGYTGSPTSPVCSSQDNAWTFTGTCTVCTVPKEYLCNTEAGTSSQCDTLTCANGFTSIGTPTSATCKASGTGAWVVDTSSPTCKAPRGACTVPTGYTCIGGASSTIPGACTAAACGIGYIGSLTAPVCTTPGNPWTFTGTCVAKTCKRPSGYAIVGTATSSTPGTVASVSCASGYTGNPTSPVCSTQDAAWTFTGTCTGLPLIDPGTQREATFELNGISFADFVKDVVVMQGLNETIAKNLESRFTGTAVLVTRFRSGSVIADTRVTYSAGTPADVMDKDVARAKAQPGAVLDVTAISEFLTLNGLPGLTDVRAGPVLPPPPTVTAVSPAIQLLAGGGTLTITGTLFVTNARVTVGDTPCTYISGGSPDGTGTNSTSITCVAPSMPEGSHLVVLTNPDATYSDADNVVVTYQPAACTVPTGYTCAGGATSSVSGACSSAKCVTGYTGTPTAPTCTIAGNPWTFTGSCAAPCTVPAFESLNYVAGSTSPCTPDSASGTSCNVACAPGYSNTGPDMASYTCAADVLTAPKLVCTEIRVIPALNPNSQRDVEFEFFGALDYDQFMLQGKEEVQRFNNTIVVSLQSKFVNSTVLVKLFKSGSVIAEIRITYPDGTTQAVMDAAVATLRANAGAIFSDATLSGFGFNRVEAPYVKAPELDDSGSNDSKALAIGLGVGLGVGIPLTAGIIFFVIRKRASQKLAPAGLSV